uniref:Spermatogenesis-associated protein 5-like protein 1 n=1 Tax=Lygus hesperus TaxID=30085 RepID=A0A0A9ZGG9_LYGHE
MALATSLLKGDAKEWSLVKRHASEDLYGVQIAASNPFQLSRASQALQEMCELDFIDINLGCPIDELYRQGVGSGMLQRPRLLKHTATSLNYLLDIPYTFKVRMGCKKPVVHNYMSWMKNSGLSMITVHGRSREQRYTRNADWDYIEDCAKKASPVPIFGNGDILSYQDYERVRTQYPTIQGVMIGRGALMKPWVFQEIKERRIMDPTSSERLEMLKLLSGDDLCLPQERWSELAKMTPGYVAADLTLVINKSRRSLHYEGLINPSEQQILSHVKQALASVEPSAVRGEMGLVKSNSSILEIGGLRRIKEVLLQSVQWPLFHADAFKRLNIKNSSGILLYGPPGCSKTSLARAVAAGSNVTFLAVSAADLYSPFVGDTERIIASLFQRARAAAPTLLFIDEIDALVGNRQGQQKRAQERVLSAFLIEIDGVGINGESEFLRDPSEVRVIIVAATNRPHVIDTALLRPGRLDKLIHVPPPDLEDRLEILEVITKKMPLDKNVDLFDIAEKTELFSGADLANLCREAALLAMTVNGVSTTTVSQENFLGALSASTPSLTASQVEWYKSFSFS